MTHSKEKANNHLCFRNCNAEEKSSSFSAAAAAEAM
jgi:hypothetical protein